MEQTNNNKINWTTLKALSSLLILIFVIIVNNFREELFGIKKGYAPHNFGFNFTVIFPLTVISFGLGLSAITGIIKHWKNWSDSNNKWILIALSSPAIGFGIFIFIKFFL